MAQSIPTRDDATTQAKALRAALARQGREIGHGQALELIAQSHGFRDWNTLSAAIGNRREPLALKIGAKVSGRYLKQGFTARVHGLRRLGADHIEITLDLDEAVNVSAFESFTALRKRVRATIGLDGTSLGHTSDGVPHLVLAL